MKIHKNLMIEPETPDEVEELVEVAHILGTKGIGSLKVMPPWAVQWAKVLSSDPDREPLVTLAGAHDLFSVKVIYAAWQHDPKKGVNIQVQQVSGPGAVGVVLGLEQSDENTRNLQRREEGDRGKRVFSDVPWLCETPHPSLVGALPIPQLARPSTPTLRGLARRIGR